MENKKLSGPAIAIRRARNGMREEVAAALLNISVRKLRRIESGECMVSQRLLDDLMYEALISRGFRMTMKKMMPSCPDIYDPALWSDVVRQQS